jgi:hypothetical protein
LAVEASASGTLPTRSRRPSPSKSTARRRKVDGMNWVWPKAPAQEPVSCSRFTSPASTILRASKNSPRK